MFDHRAGLPESDVVLLGVPDDAVEVVTAEIASSLGRDTVVVHFAGSLGLAPLIKARATGAGGAALHPVQACPDVDTALVRLPGSAWGVTADPEVEPWAISFVTRDLAGSPVIVTEAARPTWHAAAVSTSNGIAALLATGEAMLEAVGIENPQRVLGPLAAGAVANATVAGGAASLTGPVARGESETIARQVEALAASSPNLVQGYVHVIRVILDAAMRARRITDEDAERMLELLDGTG